MRTLFFSLTEVQTQSPPTSAPLYRFADYLRAVYRKRLQDKTDNLPHHPGKVFIKLALVKKESVTRAEADHFTRLTLRGHVDQILQAKESIKAEDIFGDVKTHLVVVEGAPGIGKSTFAWEQCRQWSTGELLQQFSLVVLLRLREEGVQTAKNISDLFHCSDDPALGALVGKEVARGHGEGVLLVFDGFDEFPAELRRKCFVVDVIRGSNLPKATVLVTSRPSATADLLLSCQSAIDKRIEIIGFSDEEIRAYTENVFMGRPELLAGFKEYLSAYPVVRGMMYSPLNCGIIVDVYHENYKSDRLIPHTLTQLYTEMSLFLLSKQMKTLSHDELPNSLEGFQRSNFQLYLQLKELGKLAFEAVKNQIVIFKSEEVPEGSRDLGLLMSCSELYRQGKNVTFNFFHLTLQEYMAAFYISQLPASEQRKVFVEQHQSRHLDVVWQFVAGLTRMQAIGWEEFRGRGVGVGYWKDNGYEVKDGVVRVWSSLLRCLYEAQDVGSCESIFSNLYIHYMGTDNSTPFDAYAVGYSVSLCRNAWNVNLKDNKLGPEVVRLLRCGLKPVRDGGGFVKELNLSNNPTCRGIEELVDFPQQILQQIRNLSLSHCDLRQVGFDLLADILPYLHSLELLSMHHNPGGNGSTVKLLKALGMHSTVEVLDMSHIVIGIEDAMSLSKVVHTSGNLKQLKIGNEDMASECVLPLLRTVLSPSSLRDLTVRIPSSLFLLNHVDTFNENLTKLILLSFGNLPSKQSSEVRGGIRFSSILKENKTLKELKLLIPLEETEVRAIVDSLKINHTIAKLTFAHRYHSRYFSGPELHSQDCRIKFEQ